MSLLQKLSKEEVKRVLYSMENNTYRLPVRLRPVKAHVISYLVYYIFIKSYFERIKISEVCNEKKKKKKMSSWADTTACRCG